MNDSVEFEQRGRSRAASGVPASPDAGAAPWARPSGRAGCGAHGTGTRTRGDSAHGHALESRLTCHESPHVASRHASRLSVPTPPVRRSGVSTRPEPDDRHPTDRTGPDRTTESGRFAFVGALPCSAWRGEQTRNPKAVNATLMTSRPIYPNYFAPPSTPVGPGPDGRAARRRRLDW